MARTFVTIEGQKFLKDTRTGRMWRVKRKKGEREKQKQKTWEVLYQKQRKRKFWLGTMALREIRSSKSPLTSLSISYIFGSGYVKLCNSREAACDSRLMASLPFKRLQRLMWTAFLKT